MDINERLDRYAETFDDGFPMIPLAWGRSDEQVCEIINECLEKGKDVYELGYVDNDEGVES